MKKNSNKTISVNSNGIVICYIDDNKHQFIRYENQDRPRRHSVKYQEIEKPAFNDRQHRMYLEALYGLSIYPEEMVNRMPKNIIMKIATRCSLVQKAINKWKQEIINHHIDGLFIKLFPNSPITKQIVNLDADETLNCTMSFKDLNIKPLDVAKKLVSLNLLPQNFFQLR